MNKDLPYKDRLRQTGRTTRAMKAASPGALYVVRNNTYYYNVLKRAHGREDLVIVTAAYALMYHCDRLRGVKSDVVLDHYVVETLDEVEARAWDYFNARREHFASSKRTR